MKEASPQEAVSLADQTDEWTKIIKQWREWLIQHEDGRERHQEELTLTQGTVTKQSRGEVHFL